MARLLARPVAALLLASAWSAVAQSQESPPPAAPAAAASDAAAPAPGAAAAGSEAQAPEPGTRPAAPTGEAAAANATAHATAQAGEDLAAVLAAAGSAGNLRGSAAFPPPFGGSFGGWGWGHGVQGETCCMCSRPGFGGQVVLFAAGDYSHVFGSHTALWQCNNACEVQCRFQHGHKFGCFDEQQLVATSRRIGSNGLYRIEHQRRFGNIC